MRLASKKNPMSEHTKEREWITREGLLAIVVFRMDGRTVVRPPNKEDTEYAAIALNALAGIPTEALEAGAIKGLVDSAERVLDALYRSEPVMDDLKEALAALKP